MPRVFIVNKGAHDYTPAKKYGDITFLTEGYVPKYNLGGALREIAMHINKSTPSDYILPSGHALLTALACTLFGMKHGCLNILLYKDGVYKPRVYYLKDIIGDNDD